MDYSERVRLVAKETGQLEETGLGFAIAFHRAFNNFNDKLENYPFNQNEFLVVRDGVKRIHRVEKLREKVRLLAGTRMMSREAHENVCPVD